MRVLGALICVLALSCISNVSSASSDRIRETSITLDAKPSSNELGVPIIEPPTRCSPALHCRGFLCYPMCMLCALVQLFAPPASLLRGLATSLGACAVLCT